MTGKTTLLERVAIGAASLALSVGLIAILSGFFASRDQAGISGDASSIGHVYRDLGHRHLRPGDPRPRYDSAPPTSGAHVPKPVRSDASALSDDQLLQALEVGDVVIMYGGSKPPPDAAALARSISPFTPSLAAAGQTVILARRSGVKGLIALAWTRMLRVQSASDPLLREFVQLWLGHGAPGR